MTQDTIIQYTGPSTPWTWDGPKDTVDFHRLRTSCIGQLHLKCPRKIFKNRLPLLERQDRRNLHSEDGWCGGLPSLEVLQYQFLGLPSVTLNMGYGTKGDRILHIQRVHAVARATTCLQCYEHQYIALCTMYSTTVQCTHILQYCLIVPIVTGYSPGQGKPSLILWVVGWLQPATGACSHQLKIVEGKGMAVSLGQYYQIRLEQALFILLILYFILFNYLICSNCLWHKSCMC